MAKSEREQLRDELFGYRKNTKMDKIFVDMFGNWAEDIYKYVGNFFNEEVHEYPEIYKDGENVEQKKKNLVARCIVERFQLDNSPFYEQKKKIE